MKILLASISLLLTSSAGLAAEPAATARLTTAQVIANAERLELARQFVALSQPAGDILDMIRESALYAASEQLGPDADDATRAEVEQNVDRVLAKFTPKFEAQRPAILDAYAQAYARQFTTEELRVLVAFGSSAAGKHFLASTVDIETDPVVATANKLLSDALLPVLDEFKKDACAQHAAQRVAMGEKAVCPLSEADESRSL